MKKRIGEQGFTLIEMMIVLLIISVLILIAIPNVTKHSKSIDEKGCAAYVNTIRLINILHGNLVIPMVCEGCLNWSIDLADLIRSFGRIVDSQLTQFKNKLERIPADAKNGYITQNPFPCLWSDEKVSTTYLKGAVGLSAC